MNVPGPGPRAGHLDAALCQREQLLTSSRGRRVLGRLKSVNREIAAEQALHFVTAGAERRPARATVGIKQPNQPSAGPEQIMYDLDVLAAARRVDRAETAMLHH